MSNNQNNEMNNTIAMVVVFAAVTVIGFGIILIGIAAFCTIAALCAQFKPLTISGETLTAKDGRRFVLRGLLGTIPCVALLQQIMSWMGISVQGDWISAVFALGYSISALSIEWLADTFWGQKPAIQPPPEAAAPPTLPRPEPKPFNFASWDDEREGR